MFLEERLHILLFLLLICHLSTLIWRLVPVGEGVTIHNTHVMNNVRPSLPEVVY